MTDFPDADEMIELREMLTELCDVSDGLTPWEISFIDSLCEWDGSFTEAQATKLEDIHARLIP